MLPQPLTGRKDGLGEDFRTKPQPPGTPPPLNFLSTVIFLKIKRDGNENFLRQDHQNRQLTMMS